MILPRSWRAKFSKELKHAWQMASVDEIIGHAEEDFRNREIRGRYRKVDRLWGADGIVARLLAMVISAHAVERLHFMLHVADAARKGLAKRRREERAKAGKPSRFEDVDLSLLELLRSLSTQVSIQLAQY